MTSDHRLSTIDLRGDMVDGPWSMVFNLSLKLDDLFPPRAAVPLLNLAPQPPGGPGLQMIRRGLEKFRDLKIAVVVIFLGLEQTLEDIGVSGDQALPSSAGPHILYAGPPALL